MTDYGHELEFGTFLTPLASQADAVVELAALTEVVGLDLVTVQDHPYQRKFLDVWALLATILARTSSVRVAPNVANLPLRPPYVLAKTVASLDVLSNGRVELGLGAGGFWEAIEAAGGPRRAPGDAVDALAEAIAVLRAMWDPSTRAVRVDGAHYRVVGAHAGPPPAHPVSLWIGALGPRMLKLTGRVADGWLPSMSYVPPDQLAERNEIIDDAAVRAGRAPTDVRRLYNVSVASGGGPGLVGTPADWAEQLADLTITHGMSAFILATDDPDTVRRFAIDVAPAVRELVDAERTGTTVAPPARPSSGFEVRATPEPGIRRSADARWDESLRPSYALAGSHEYSPEQQAVARHLVDIHDHLRAELTQLLQVIEQVAAGALEAGAARSLINTMTMRQNTWTLGAFCESYCRVVTTHHSLEDASVFPHLRRRDAGLAPVLDRLEVEHHVIAEVLDDVDRSLVALVTRPDGMSAVQRAVDLLSDTLLSHLAYEERELLEPLARYGFY